MRHEIPHDLHMDLAKLAARKAVEAYALQFEKFDFKSSWRSDTHVDISFAIKGKRLAGTFTVHADKLLLELEVPFLFRVFSGRAVDIVDTAATEWLEKAKRGELG